MDDSRILAFWNTTKRTYVKKKKEGEASKTKGVGKTIYIPYPERASWISI